MTSKTSQPLKTGVDLVEIERFKGVVDRFGQRFLQRVFTAKELDLFGENMISLAGRFGAKEAVAKALGTGIGDITWREIEILRGPAREPILHLHGAASDRANTLRLQTWSVSLSHTETHAIAFVVAIGGDE